MKYIITFEGEISYMKPRPPSKWFWVDKSPDWISKKFADAFVYDTFEDAQKISARSGSIEWEIRFRAPTMIITKKPTIESYTDREYFVEVLREKAR